MRWPIILMGLYAVAALAQEPEPETRLYVMDVPPYSLVGSERHGIVGDVVLEAMRRADLKPKLIEVPNARALHDVPHLENTLIVPLARLSEREANFTWIARVITVERAFFTLNKKVKTLTEAKKQFSLIGVERGSAAHSILISHGFTEDRLIDISLDSMGPKMLQAGRIDAWFGVKRANNKDLVISPIREASTEQYLACSKLCDGKMVKRLDEAVRAMEADGATRKIVASYQ